MKKYYVGIDFGGMSAKAGLFDDKGTMIAKDTVKTSREEGYVTTVTKMAQLTRSLAEKCGGMKNVAAVGVGYLCNALLQRAARRNTAPGRCIRTASC